MKFKANNLTWDIDYVESDKTLINNEHGIYLGLCEYIPQRISIRSGMTKEMTRETVIHELVHCFLFSFGNYGRTEINEEQVCNFVGSHIDKIIEVADKFLKG